jgi:hypothetical protein
VDLLVDTDVSEEQFLSSQWAEYAIRCCKNTTYRPGFETDTTRVLEIANVEKEKDEEFDSNHDDKAEENDL